MERLMGLENEYAARVTGPRGGGIHLLRALQELNAIAREELPCLPSLNGNGIFLANGGRLYLDTGAHQEWCSPETANPWDVVRYLDAGERILVGLAEKLVERRRLGNATFYKTNVDYYSGTCGTWGAHENFMHRADPAKLPAALIPFLVSRVIMTGAGGFDPTKPASCRFVLSPRAFHIKASVSSSSTSERGIYHTKDEPLCDGGNHRLHVLVGDSLCSQTGNWLKFATTALVVAMAEAGLQPGSAVALRSPLDALKTFASDPSCKASAASSAGGCLSAIEIQQHYLDLARVNASAQFMPSWASRAVKEWDAMLKRLRHAPDGVATCLDWAIKNRIYGARIQKKGFTWEMLDAWSNLLELLRTCAELSAAYAETSPINAEFLANPHGPLKGIIDHLGPQLIACGMNLDQFDRFVHLRSELFEIDTRFGELGSKGIFNTLDQAGVLHHRFPGVDNISHAVNSPPLLGRAKVRGDAIQRLKGHHNRFACDWSAIVDTEASVMLDLRNPWATSENWIPNPISNETRAQFFFRQSRSTEAIESIF